MNDRWLDLNQLMDATPARSGRCGCAARHLTANVVEEFAFFFSFFFRRRLSFFWAPTDDQVL